MAGLQLRKKRLVIILAQVPSQQLCVNIQAHHSRYEGTFSVNVIRGRFADACQYMCTWWCSSRLYYCYLTHAWQQLAGGDGAVSDHTVWQFAGDGAVIEHPFWQFMWQTSMHSIWQHRWHEQHCQKQISRYCSSEQVNESVKLSWSELQAPLRVKFWEIVFAFNSNMQYSKPHLPRRTRLILLPGETKQLKFLFT